MTISPSCWDRPRRTWGSVPRDFLETIFELAMKGRETEREDLARLLHGRHPRGAVWVRNLGFDGAY